MKTLEELEGLVTSKANVLKALASLVKLEAKLAGLSFGPLIMNLLVMFVIFITVWFSGMVLLAYGLYLLLPYLIISILTVCVLNLVLMMVLMKCISFNIKNMSFAKTREYFTTQDADYDEFKKACASSNNSPRKKIENSTE